MTSRTLSFTEISSAMTCQAQHAFRYTGHLTGGQTLKSRMIAPRLSDGRAWGAGVAAWHATSGTLLAPLHAAQAAQDSLRMDMERMAEAGVPLSPQDFVDRSDLIEELLTHYTETAEPFSNLTRLEGEVNVPIRSRTGRLHSRGSSRYRFQCFIDGYTVDLHGQQWVVEFKLRDQLTTVEHIHLGRQPLWYAAALRVAQDGHAPVGVIVDERLKEIPKPPRLVQAKKKGQGKNGLVPSHSKDQITTPLLYLAACEEYKVECNANTVIALGQRRWQQRVPILFREDELDRADMELVSAAQTIRDLDAGRYPVRNARPSICNSCDFRRICQEPEDELYVDSLFLRTVPKRLRVPGMVVA